MPPSRPRPRRQFGGRAWLSVFRSPHKSAQTLRLIQKLGAHVLFLPAYSPDLNPIEKMWSKLKEFLRSAQAPSQPSLIQAMASALAAITPQDAMNWFASCGYSFIYNAL
jgi:transposase